MQPAATFQAVIDRYLGAYGARDAARCAAFYAEDAVLLSPYGPPARGRGQIAARHRDWFKDGETGKTMRVTRAGIDGAAGYCLVEYTAKLPGTEGRADRASGTSLNVMTRGRDGLWTITLSSLNELEEHFMESDR